MRTITKKQLFRKLGNFVSVNNTQPCGSYLGGVASHYEIHFERGEIFQSYGTIIAAKIGGELFLTVYHDYSATTCRHTKKWTGYNAEERRKGLDNGTILAII